MKSYPAKFKSFQRKIVQMGAQLKLQNSIQILTILWLVYPIHTNSLQVIFEKLPFCHFPPLSTSVLDKDSQIQLIFHFNILVFQTNGKQPYFFPVLSRFCNCQCNAYAGILCRFYAGRYNNGTESRPGWTKIQEMYKKCPLSLVLVLLTFLKERRGYIVTSLPSLFIGQSAACLFLQKVPDLPRKVYWEWLPVKNVQMGL